MTKTLVLGLGDSGLAMARHLAARGQDLRIADTRADPPGRDEAAAEFPQADIRCGPFDANLLDDIERVAISPGLAPTQPPAAALVKQARASKLAVVGEIELFALELARLKAESGYAPAVLGITGTNGKTTTARLTGRLVERSGRDVAVAGNIGPPALDALRERMATCLPAVWVLELSSFQLATTSSLECDAAAVLNISQDHLDWHGSLDAYAAAKQRIFSKHTVQVLNRDDERIAAMAKKGVHSITFGGTAPRQGDSYGIVDDSGMPWLAWAEDLAAPSRRRKPSPEPAATELHLHRLMPLDALRLRGRHNALNALAAMALARAIGCPLAPMLHELREFEGEPHRVQPLGTIGGVEYFNDSKGTNVGATVAALEGLGSEGRKLVVILGGDGKGQDFRPLMPAVARHVRAVVLIGRDAPTLRSLIGEQVPAMRLEAADSLPAAVFAAAALAQPGDAVLLSPACASLDMFRNYVHRGEVFAAAVRELSIASAPMPLEGAA
jgi:UDP-N-acetylmuramoylalanine--D-glutamate ligase